ncbi:hypothetical protein CYMTET_51482 [Cymbomonas tetramitiformis]|uniref:CCHC-type domain-containing protein n=1 Tax=Cymbomonas tetramitiformis TaxID=36881 RepID=A0AAE0BKZ1_9CHLO|nr:hypothetical protein CYMTET_51482 [Cymbomonas tetramitiformis]
MIGQLNLEEGCSHCKAVNHKLAACPVLARELRDKMRSGADVPSPTGPLSVASSSSKASTRSSSACYYCRKDGHGIAVCPALADKKRRTSRAQEQQKKPAARAQEQPRLRESKRPASGQPKCCICQGTGHPCYGREHVKEPTRNRYCACCQCSQCGDFGHYAKSSGDLSLTLSCHPKVLVELSRSLDHKGVLGAFTFIIPIIMDSIFHKLLPSVFAPNVLNTLQNQKYSFTEV